MVRAFSPYWYLTFLIWGFAPGWYGERPWRINGQALRVSSTDELFAF
jgi:hypothetical protein